MMMTHGIVLRDPALGNDGSGLNHQVAPTSHGHTAHMDEMVISSMPIVGRVYIQRVSCSSSQAHGVSVWRGSRARTHAHGRDPCPVWERHAAKLDRLEKLGRLAVLRELVGGQEGPDRLRLSGQESWVALDPSCGVGRKRRLGLFDSVGLPHLGSIALVCRVESRWWWW